MTRTDEFAPDTAVPGHGAAFTDHMITMDWDARRGWHDRRVAPLAERPLHPATLGLHYAQVVFEGLKAHRGADGAVTVFRPDRNAARFAASARRMAMPELPAEAFLAAVDELVGLDAGELPADEGVSLYLRPLMYGTESHLMLRPSEEYRFLLIAYLTGGFFGADPLAPVTVHVSREHTRAAPGGTGDVKCAANYAPTFVAQRAAAAAGCQQVVWLDSTERRWVEEMGAMNVFFVRRTGAGVELVTPPLTGTLLPGVTRETLLALAARIGLPAVEERVSVDEWRDGRIVEAFASGTAAVVTPIGAVRDAAGDFTVGDGSAGPVTRRLRQLLVDTQRGAAPDPDGWRRPVPPAATVDRVRRYYRLVDAGDVAGLVDLFAPDAVYHRPGYPPIAGRAALTDFYTGTRVIRAGEHTVEQVVGTGPQVAVHGSFAGVLHDGTRVQLRFSDFFQDGPAGRFVRRDTFFFTPMV